MQIGAYTKIPMWCHPYGLKGNRREKKLDDLKCSPGSDNESQDIFTNVCPGHGQSKHFVLTYFVSETDQTTYCYKPSRNVFVRERNLFSLVSTTEFVMSRYALSPLEKVFLLFSYTLPFV